ncbi:MAG: hypothetical protein ACM3ML_18000, partial [Micromonosporaceae bacterium]
MAKVAVLTVVFTAAGTGVAANAGHPRQARHEEKRRVSRPQPAPGRSHDRGRYIIRAAPQPGRSHTQGDPTTPAASQPGRLHDPGGST